MYIMNKTQIASSEKSLPELHQELKIYLKEEEFKHKRNGRNSGQKSCQRCGFCCLRQPCIPTPQEFGQIAKSLNMSSQELVSKYCVINESPDGFYVMWIRENQEDIAGALIPFYRTFDHGYCIFFNKEKRACAIHTCRPYTAKQTACWQKKQKEYKALWTTEEIKEILPSFDPKESFIYQLAHIIYHV